MNNHTALAIAGALAATIGVNAAADAMAPRMKPQATAAIMDASGAAKVDATITQRGADLTVEAEVRGMAPGAYGIHLHMIGKCDAPDFTTAGAHWNPAMRQHGLNNPAGAHKGDLPNLVVGGSGTGRIKATVPAASLTGDTALLDADGAAIVIHAKPDDAMTDPSGNSGGRIACGVLKAG